MALDRPYDMQYNIFLYIVAYVKNGTTYYGDFYEVTLRNRPNLNRISDFLRDYYKSIDLLNFDGLMVKIMNSLNSFIDISANLSSSDKEEQSKFEKTIQRILGICFDNNKEIDVSGNAKLSSLDNIDESFFEMTPLDLKNIETEDPLVSITNISKLFSQFFALSKISFDINENEVIGLLGLNGAGKTTLLKIISGLMSPTKGNVNYLKDDINNNNFNEYISVVLSQNFLYDDLTLRENLVFFSKLLQG